MTSQSKANAIPPSSTTGPVVIPFPSNPSPDSASLSRSYDSYVCSPFLSNNPLRSPSLSSSFTPLVSSFLCRTPSCAAMNGSIANSPSGANQVIRNSPAERSAVDAYARNLLKQNSPAEVRLSIDDSLGPYITSILRDSIDATFGNYPDVTQLAEYENLVELVIEHCAMTNVALARETLIGIYQAVCTGAIPSDGNHNDTSLFLGLMDSLLENGRDDMDELDKSSRIPDGECGEKVDDLEYLVNQMIQPSDDEGNADCSSSVGSSISSANHHPHGKVTPCFDAKPEGIACGEKSHTVPIVTPTKLKDMAAIASPAIDMHLPSDLLAAMDDPSTPVPRKLIITAEGRDGVLPKTLNFGGAGSEDPTSTGLVLPTQGPSTNIATSKKEKKKAKDKKAKDLAAALFRPARPRSNSNLSDKSPKLLQPSPNNATCLSLGGQMPPFSLSSTSNTGSEHSISSIKSGYPQRSSILSKHAPQNELCHPEEITSLQQQQLQIQSASEILLTMNVDLSEAAALEAALVSNADINVAQYLLDQATSAPPVCRHMLHNACYRSDCQFSHDVEGHTCSFWMKGRCGKGDECRFLHGFHEKLLEGMIQTPVKSEEESCGKNKRSGRIRSSSMGGVPQSAQPQGICIVTNNLVSHNQTFSSMRRLSPSSSIISGHVASSSMEQGHGSMPSSYDSSMMRSQNAQGVGLNRSSSQSIHTPRISTAPKRGDPQALPEVSISAASKVGDWKEFDEFSSRLDARARQQAADQEKKLKQNTISFSSIASRKSPPPSVFVSPSNGKELSPVSCAKANKASYLPGLCSGEKPNKKGGIRRKR
eukprot:CAMPEP_0195529172 /NCGR_PEP_ID=MMETSP0794_2-20130614/31614_1 /TAXON_ID=515487 /ORGANISM="Stephanopyxis turris, Strain CCMP 815" /LENGTH=819 /DNA_ID=CAMNT_0040660437 /DNA_START=305 /DNA_END=2764 /DNA_ORIENTATION=-